MLYTLPDVPGGNKMLHHPCVLLIAYVGYIHKWQTLDEVAEFQYRLQIAISVQTRPKKEIQKIIHHLMRNLKEIPYLLSEFEYQIRLDHKRQYHQT